MLVHCRVTPALNSPLPIYTPEHCHPQRQCSFWSAPRIATSGLVQHRKSAIHRVSVESVKSDWLRIWNKNSTCAQKIRSSQRSRFLVLTKRSMASGDVNNTWVERGTMRVLKAQEHNTLSPARVPTQTVQGGDERTNHEATAPPQS